MWPVSEGPLNQFRAFILDNNNRIIRAEVLEVQNAEEALGAALLFAGENDLAVWLGSERIARVLKGGTVQKPEGKLPRT